MWSTEAGTIWLVPSQLRCYSGFVAEYVVVTGARSGLGRSIYDLANRYLFDTAVIPITKSVDELPGSVVIDFSDYTTIPSGVNGLIARLPNATRVTWILCAGIYDRPGLKYPNLCHAVGEVFLVNCYGQLAMIDSCVEELASCNHRVVGVTSGMASISETLGRDHYLYAGSKAALNLCLRLFATQHSNVECIVVDPGWMRTKLGGSDAPIAPERSASKILSFVAAHLDSFPEQDGILNIQSSETMHW